jgi:hypothetical protein
VPINEDGKKSEIVGGDLVIGNTVKQKKTYE